jgi:hypothetical protein
MTIMSHLLYVHLVTCHPGRQILVRLVDKTWCTVRQKRLTHTIIAVNGKSGEAKPRLALGLGILRLALSGFSSEIGLGGRILFINIWIKI